MKASLSKILLAAASLVALADAASAAGFTGDDKWMIRGRAIGVLPNEEADISLIGGDVDIDNTVVPELDFTYFVTKNIGLELIAAVTPHDVKAVNTLSGDIDLGDVWLLPPTLTLQYHFYPTETIKPYIGAGINYTHFFGEDSGAVTDIDYDDSFGAALQAGVDVAIDDRWSVNFDVKRVWINSDVTINSSGTIIDADVDIDPWVIGLGIGYRF